jgi:predicted acetyltransferase
VTLAVDRSGRVHGYASWQRGGHVGDRARLEVADLVATAPDAARLLLRAIGSFVPVAPTTRLRTSPADLVRYVLPRAAWRVVASEPYMLRLLDPGAAFALRAYPRRLDADLVFGIADEFLSDLDGAWRLTVRDGTCRCERTDEEPGPVFTGRGLAASYAGTQSTSNLRMAGLLWGDSADDDTWDALLAGRQVHVRDYF